jgi:hypothetical protein
MQPTAAPSNTMLSYAATASVLDARDAAQPTGAGERGIGSAVAR